MHWHGVDLLLFTSSSVHCWYWHQARLMLALTLPERPLIWLDPTIKIHADHSTVHIK